MKDKNGTEQSAAEVYLRLRDMDYDELLEEMEEILDVGVYSSELIFAYDTVLEEKRPCPVEYDPDHFHQDMEKRFPELFEVDRPKRTSWVRLSRFKRILILAAVLVGALSVIAVATTIPRLLENWQWNADTFRVEPRTGRIELLEATEEGFYSVQDALDYYKIKDQVAPCWVPHKYSLTLLDVLHPEKSETITFVAQYTSDDEKVINLRIQAANTVYGTNNEMTEAATAETFWNNGNRYEIAENEGQLTANWETTYCFARISGDITRDELELMLKSISEEKIP